MIERQSKENREKKKISDESKMINIGKRETIMTKKRKIGLTYTNFVLHCSRSDKSRANTSCMKLIYEGSIEQSKGLRLNEALVSIKRMKRTSDKMGMVKEKKRRLF